MIDRRASDGDIVHALAGERWRTVEECRDIAGGPLNALIPRLNRLHYEGRLERRLDHQRFLLPEASMNEHESPWVQPERIIAEQVQVGDWITNGAKDSTYAKVTGIARGGKSAYFTFEGGGRIRPRYTTKLWRLR